MSTKKKTLKEIPITGKFYNEPITSYDLRLSFTKVGIEHPGSNHILFTVPNDYIYRMTDLYCIEIDWMDDVWFEVVDSVGNILYRVPEAYLLKNGANLMENPIKLLGGDIVRVWYDTTNLAGEFSCAVMGVLEYDTLKIR